MAASPSGKPPIKLSPFAKGKSYDFTFQSPKGVELVADSVQQITRENNAPGYSRPTVGTAHPDAARFPLHVLTVVIPDPQAQTDKLFYVAPRAPVVSYQVNATGQVETITQSLINEGETLPTATELLSFQTENLTNGKLKLIKTLVPAVFSGLSRSVGTVNAIPLRFRSISGVATTHERIPGTVWVTPVLSAGEVEHGETQVTNFIKEVVITSKDETIHGFLQGQDFDSKLGIPKPYTETLTSDISGALGVAGQEVSPISDTLAIIKKSDSSAMIAALSSIVIVTPETINYLPLPDILESVKVIYEFTKGEGQYSEIGGSSALSVTDQTMAASGEASGSAAAIPDIVPSIKEHWARQIPSTKALFFLPIPISRTDIVAALTALMGTAVTDWPQFTPARHQITATGSRVSLTARTKAHYTIAADLLNASTVKGEGYSTEIGMMQRTAHIAPTIHDEITIELVGASLDPVTVTSHSEAIPFGVESLYVPGVIADVSKNAIVGVGVSVSTLPSTGASSVPTSGLHLWHCTSEPYAAAVDSVGFVTRFAMVSAEIIDMADVPPAASGAGTGSLGSVGVVIL